MKLLLVLFALLTWAPAFGAEIRGGGLVLPAQVVVSSGGTKVLSLNDQQVIEVTGSAAHTIRLPDASDVGNGWFNYVINNSSAVGGVSVNDDSGTLVMKLDFGQVGFFQLIDATLPKGRWARSRLTPSGGAGGGVDLTAFSADAPLVYNNVTGKFSIPVATGAANGYLSAADFTTFAAKLTSPLTTKGDTLGHNGTVHGRLAVGADGQLLTADTASTFGFKWAPAPVSLPSQTGNSGKYLTTDGSMASWMNVPAGVTRNDFSATAPMSYNNTTGVFSMPAATSGQNGYLTSSDWSIFNGKQAAGNYLTALTGDVVATGPGSAASTIQPGVITTTKIADLNVTDTKMADNSIPLRAMQTASVNGNALTVGAVDLASSKVTGVAPVVKGGTGTGTLPAAGQVLASNGTGYVPRTLQNGGKNYVQNPSGEYNATSGITAANTTVASSTTAPFLGDSSELQFLVDSATDRVTFALDTFPERLKTVGFCRVEIPFKADANADNVAWEVWRAGGSVPVAQGRFYNPGTGLPGYAGGNFLCGDLTAATEIRIQGTAALATNLRVANVQVREADASKENIGATDYASVTFPGVAGCDWTTAASNKNPQDFPANASCATSIPVFTGAASASATVNTPRFNMRQATGDIYYFLINGQLNSSGTGCSYRMSNGTDSTPLVAVASSAGSTFTARAVASSAGIAEWKLQATGQNGSETCNAGNSMISRMTNIAVMKVPSDGALFNVRNQSGNFDTIPYVPVLTNTSTNGNQVFTYSREGEYMNVHLNYITASAPAALMSISIPAGLKIDFNKLSSNTSNIVGYGTRGVGSTLNSLSVIGKSAANGGADNLLYFSAYGQSGINPATPQNANTVLGSGELIDFNARFPIQGWTKSNVSSNIAGEPGVYHGRHAAGCGWSITSTTPADFGTDATCSASQVENVNFGTVNISSTLPQVDFVPKQTGYFMGCVSTDLQNGAASQSAVALLTDGTKVLDRAAFYAPNTTTVSHQKLCGPFFGTGGTSKTLKLQGAASSGNAFVGDQTGNPNAATEWTIYPLTQNLKLEGGTVGRSEVTLTNDTGFGSTNTNNRLFAAVQTSGSDLRGFNDAALGSSVVVQSGGEGEYTINWVGARMATANTCYITKNLVGVGFSLPMADPNASVSVLGTFDQISNGSHMSFSTTVWLNAGDVIRAANFGASNAVGGNGPYQYLKVTKVTK